MKYNRIFKYLFVILIMAMVSACVKDKPVPIADGDCFNIIQPTLVSFVEGRIQYKTPFFNPNDANEFIYHYRDYLNEEYHLMKYNIQTKEKTLIVNSGIIGSPKWSGKRWIAYKHSYQSVNQIFCIKDNGDSLQQFTENHENEYPTWNSYGSKLLWLHSPVLGIPYYFLEQDLYQTMQLDTLTRNGDKYNGYAESNNVSVNNDLVSFAYLENKGCLAISNLNDSVFSFTKVLNFENTFNYPRPSGLCWSHDGSHLYSTHTGGQMRGLYKVTLNGSFEKLIAFCDSKKYEAISTSPDGKFLIAERIDSYLSSNFSGTVFRNSSIYLIDLATLEEIKVDLE